MFIGCSPWNRHGLYTRHIKNILNELMVLTQPGFLQQYVGGPLRPFERDIRRASLIRERLKMEDQELGG